MESKREIGSLLLDGVKPICVRPTTISIFVTAAVYLIDLIFEFSDFQRHGYITSSVKLKLRLPIVPENKCQDDYSLTKIRLGAGQLCAGGIKGQDSCSADSGGPLMYFDQEKASHVLSGVVSFGPRNCGTAGLPGVYTKVERYTDWIVANVER